MMSQTTLTAVLTSLQAVMPSLQAVAAFAPAGPELATKWGATTEGALVSTAAAQAAASANLIQGAINALTDVQTSND